MPAPKPRPFSARLRKKTVGLLLTSLPLLMSLTLFAQSFSDWNQANGYKKVEYRWRQNESKACELEYRNTDNRDKKTYKSRVVFRQGDDEHEKPYTIVSFGDAPPYVETVPACSEITDVSVTRF